MSEVEQAFRFLEARGEALSIVVQRQQASRSAFGSLYCAPTCAECEALANKALACRGCQSSKHGHAQNCGLRELWRSVPEAFKPDFYRRSAHHGFHEAERAYRVQLAEAAGEEPAVREQRARLSRQAQDLQRQETPLAAANARRRAYHEAMLRSSASSEGPSTPASKYKIYDIAAYEHASFDKIDDIPAEKTPPSGLVCSVGLPVLRHS